MTILMEICLEGLGQEFIRVGRRQSLYVFCPFGLLGVASKLISCYYEFVCQMSETKTLGCLDYWMGMQDYPD